MTSSQAVIPDSSVSAAFDELIASLSAEEAHRLQQSLRYRWGLWARPEQLPPDGEWDVWGMCAGRGGGKTRPGAQWANRYAFDHPGCRLAFVGRTAADVRDTMILGESGILACSPPWFYPRYVPSKRLVAYPNGSEGHLYSAEKPDLLRGPQFHGLWGDEFSTWKRVRDEQGGDAWSNAQDGLRLGEHPQAVLTFTPRPTDLVLDTCLGPRNRETGRRVITPDQARGNRWVLELEHEDHLGRKTIHRTVIVRWSTERNELNLSRGFAAKRRSKYAGTRLGAQELDAALLLASDTALWRQETIDLYRVTVMGAERERLVVALDPTKSEFRPRDECGISVACRCKDQHAYVLEDATMRGSPYDWASRALDRARTYNADAIVYESSGLDQSVRDTLQVVASASGIHWEPRTASKGKKARAEPVSACYVAGRVHHLNREGETFEFLEDEMITWEPNDKKSPNRLDALVWAITDLLLSSGNEPPLVMPGLILRGEH